MESTTLIGSSLDSCDVNKQKMGMYSKHTYRLDNYYNMTRRHVYM